jgi:hypothetical protein
MDAQRQPSGMVAGELAAGRRERKRFAITYPLDTYPLERFLVLIWYFFIVNYLLTLSLSRK